MSAWPLESSTRLAWSTSAKYAAAGASPQSRWEKSPHTQEWITWPAGVADGSVSGKIQLWSSTASRLWRIEREAAAESEAAESMAAAEEGAAATADDRPVRSRERRDRERGRPASRMQRAWSEPAQKNAKPRALAAMPEVLGKPSNVVGPIADLRRAHLWTKDFVSSGSPSLVATSDDFGDVRLHELTIRHNEGIRMKQERRRRNPIVALGKGPPQKPGKQTIREIQHLCSQVRSLSNPTSSKPASPSTPGLILDDNNLAKRSAQHIRQRKGAIIHDPFMNRGDRPVSSQEVKLRKDEQNIWGPAGGFEDFFKEEGLSLLSKEGSMPASPSS